MPDVQLTGSQPATVSALMRAQPSEIEACDMLPKTRSGKIVRRHLEALEMGEDRGDLSMLAD